ncbi:unnamed protein product [Caenorhabditis angaria]|uniref:G-protein coupled receptors family 1 profile domain-containing protein n=1 Tax=Caenorhabditis angaria TaxID=860376 RepID=A0A9P1N777_9PELO|nr:unnamed protein product [Caenorhabditis angaria]
MRAWHKDRRVIMDDASEWVKTSLSFEDWFAGLSLLLISTVSFSIYILVLRIMKRQDKDIVGYRFLISAGFCDLLLLFNYGFWPGLTILFKSEIIDPKWRSEQQIYLDWAWFSMVSHYSIVGWSRWQAIRKPHDFRNQKRRVSYFLCSACFLIAAVLVLSTHFQKWYVTFYYDPASYGMLSENFQLYLSGGQSMLFLAFHIVAIVPPCVFYTWSIILLYQRRQAKLLINHSTQNSIERKLLMPCLINVITFIIGQILITVGGEGKWAGYMVMLLFCANSALNPFLLLICSRTLRRQLLECWMKTPKNLNFDTKADTSTIFRNVHAAQSDFCISSQHTQQEKHCFTFYKSKSATPIYSFMGYQIFIIVKSHQNKMSRSQKLYHRKVSIELLVQTFLKISSIGIYGIWWMLLYIFAPTGNMTHLTVFCHCTFVGGSIPSTIYIILKHPTYLKNLKNRVLCESESNQFKIFIRSSGIH